MTKVLSAVALALISGSTPVLAHGAEHKASAYKYDAGKVEVTAFGREGNPTKVSRTIQVDMADTMRFTPADFAVKRSETIRFVIRNSGRQLHEMVLGTAQALKEHAELMKKFPEMEHADANMAHVKPGATGEIVWQFTNAGQFQFACLLPGHYAAGMVGTLAVK